MGENNRFCHNKNGLKKQDPLKKMVKKGFKNGKKQGVTSKKMNIVMQKMHYNTRHLCNMHIKAADIPMRFGEMC